MLGKIIGIEGTDGSGKQTQTQMLFSRLEKEGYPVIRQSFPNYESESSGPVKMYLGGELAIDEEQPTAEQASTLYAVDRFCTYRQGFYEDYKQGKIIIMDRYVQSNMLHQTVRLNSVKDKDKFLLWLENLEYGLFGLPRPDVVIFLDMPVEASKKISKGRANKTGKKQDIHEDDTNHMQKAYENAKYLANKYNWLVVKCTNDEGLIRTIEDINEEIYKLVINKVI